MHDAGGLMSKPVLAMIETPRGVLDAAAIAPAAAGLIAGTNDLAATLGLPEQEAREGLVYALQRIVLAARAAGIAAFDGVYNGLEADAGLAAECAAGPGLRLRRQDRSSIPARSRPQPPVRPDRRGAGGGAPAGRGGDGRGGAPRGRMVEAMHVETARRLIARARGRLQGSTGRLENGVTCPLWCHHSGPNCLRPTAGSLSSAMFKGLASASALAFAFPRHRARRADVRARGHAGGTARAISGSLASDDFQGRAPGTEGERRTIAYIVEQFRARGARAGGRQRHLAPDDAARRAPARRRRRCAGPAPGRASSSGDELVMTGREASETLADAPLIFAGHGARMPDRGIDQLAGADVQGAVVLILFQGPQVEGFPSIAERVRAVTAAGAAAVIVIVGDDLPWADRAQRGPPRGTPPGRCERPAFLGAHADGRGATPDRGAPAAISSGCSNEQPGSSFRSVTLPGRVSIDVTTAVRRVETSNVIGRLRGSGATRRERASASPIGTISASAGPKARPTGSATARSTMRAGSPP